MKLELEKGDIIILPDPNETDSWPAVWSDCKVVGFRKSENGSLLVTVEDAEENAWDLEYDRALEGKKYYDSLCEEWASTDWDDWEHADHGEFHPGESDIK